MIAKMKKGVPRDEKPLSATPEAKADAEAAIRLVRSRAEEWDIDPHRVGVVGFSAGAMTALAVGLTEAEDARADFIAPIYGPMGPRPVPEYAPPMFVAVALDDRIFAKGRNSMGLIDAWRHAGHPVEAHLYEQGGHGFGMKARTAAASQWIEQFYAWMQDRGIINK